MRSVAPPLLNSQTQTLSCSSLLFPPFLLVLTGRPACLDDSDFLFIVPIYPQPTQHFETDDNNGKNIKNVIKSTATANQLTLCRALQLTEGQSQRK